MSGMNLCRCLRTCKKNVIQDIFDARLASTSYTFLNNRKLISNCGMRKHLHTTGTTYQSLCRLKSRGVIQMSGDDTPAFLQGLVTNNILALTEKFPSIQFCMMLNVQGRVLYDLFVYNITKAETDPMTCLIDVDDSAVNDLLKIFKKYKLRKKIDISNVSDRYKIWTEFDIGGQVALGKYNTSAASANIFQFHDPRVPVFANRIVTDQDHLDKTHAVQATEEDYRIHRYKWGIPEGTKDLPSGKCLPLESNLDYMNGVDFQKGCYIGQELTARTFHTGVIRKRLLPIELDSPSATIEPETVITTQEKGKNAGKFRSSEGSNGLCLLRLQHASDNLEVLSQDGQKIPVKAHLPKWWPNTSL
uniref:CAF17 C-terminal domain-containing protein n=1 Tax=Arion vulgaris TaxID=1028688 RepID=A0A0B7A4T8_9EUPU